MDCLIFFKFESFLLMYPCSEWIILISANLIVLENDDETIGFLGCLILISTILFYFHKIFLTDFFHHSKNFQPYQLFNWILAALEYVFFVIFTYFFSSWFDNFKALANFSCFPFHSLDINYYQINRFIIYFYYI